MGLRDIAIIILVAICGVLTLQLQTAKYEAKETKLIHEKLVAEQKEKNATLIAEVNSEKQLQAEVYAIEINRINDLYVTAMSDSKRMQSEIKTYTDRLHTVSREAVENYATTASTIFGECRSEYVTLGQYAAKLDAELNTLTRQEDSK